MIIYEIIDNKLFIDNDGVITEYVIYTFEEHCGSSVFKLNPKFKILNSLFTTQKEYIPQNPRGILPGTSFKTSYIGTSLPNCQYLTFNEKVLQLTPLSRAVPPRREILQLYQNNYKYLIKYKSNSKIQFLNLIPFNNQAYPLVDSKGNTLKPVEGEGSFTTEFWPLIVVRLLPNQNLSNVKVEIEIEAIKEVNSILSKTGEICLKFEGVSIKVATKFAQTSSIEQVPVPKLKWLAEMLYAINRIQSFDPCFETVLSVTPPGPFITTPVQGEVPTEVTINFMENVIENYNLGYYGILTMPPTIEENLAVKVGNVFNLPKTGPVSSLLYLYRSTEPSGINNITYDISYNIRLIYHGIVPIAETPSFWLAANNGLGMSTYAKLCDSPSLLTHDFVSSIETISGGDSVVTFNNSYRINNCSGTDFIIGFFAGIIPDGYPQITVGAGSYIKIGTDQNNQICLFGNC